MSAIHETLFIPNQFEDKAPMTDFEKLLFLKAGQSDKHLEQLGDSVVNGRLRSILIDWSKDLVGYKGQFKARWYFSYPEKGRTDYRLELIDGATDTWLKQSTITTYKQYNTPELAQFFLYGLRSIPAPKESTLAGKSTSILVKISYSEGKIITGEGSIGVPINQAVSLKLKFDNEGVVTNVNSYSTLQEPEPIQDLSAAARVMEIDQGQRLAEEYLGRMQHMIGFKIDQLATFKYHMEKPVDIAMKGQQPLVIPHFIFS